jgi:hypothetical protein
MALVPKVFVQNFTFSGSGLLSSTITALNLTSQSGVLVGVAIGPRRLEGGSKRVFYNTLNLVIDGNTVLSVGTPEGIEALASLFGDGVGSRLLFRLPFSNSISLSAQVRREDTTVSSAAIAVLVLVNE